MPPDADLTLWERYPRPRTGNDAYRWYQATPERTQAHTDIALPARKSFPRVLVLRTGLLDSEPRHYPDRVLGAVIHSTNYSGGSRIKRSTTHIKPDTAPGTVPGTVPLNASCYSPVRKASRSAHRVVADQIPPFHEPSGSHLTQPPASRPQSECPKKRMWTGNSCLAGSLENAVSALASWRRWWM
jgi:hypothetical protein